ncbi:MAG: MBOAT family protein [Lachnospiraceae bacterium]|nr:MBOAT family protein [Lachnospiraceae bacterium]MBQ7261374.1 MBOAT family protein [Lachnospiraceae bacterium]HAU99580.1 transcriptional regulator [Lachnospiraceae bacterium]
MIFSSLLFLFWFMPVFFAVYYLVPAKAKNIVLFLGSIVFYAWGEPKYLLLILVSILVNYILGLLIGRFSESEKIRKTFFIAALVFDISLLLFFKYIGFFISNINSAFGAGIPEINVSLPLGISFYTFQIMSYIIDLYRGKVKAETSVLRLGTYIVMFPQLIAGPIVVYSEVSEGLKKRSIRAEDVEEGLKVFILGLASKVLIANNVGMLWKELSQIGYDRISTPLAWLGALAFTLQIYFDFNGYSLMATGLGRMLGFSFPKNFDHPYVSVSITEFWRRWHITLSSWFREYLYFPLGGSRKGPVRNYVNLLIVWAVTGFWHGADWNFILWGLYFFVLLSIEKLFLLKRLKDHRTAGHIYTMFFVIISWVIFSITDPGQLSLYLTRLFGGYGGEDILYYLRNYGCILLLGCLFSTPVFEGLYRRIKDRSAGVFVSLALLVCSVAYLADASFNPFLYFRF